MLFVGLLLCWMLFPFLQIGTLAEDAVPFIAAGRVDATDASDLYSSDQAREVPTPLRDAGCPLVPPGTDCDRYVFPFLAPPQVLPVMFPISALGDVGSILFMRLLGAASFAGAPRYPRSSAAPAGIPTSGFGSWARGAVRITSAVPGAQLTSRATADAVCAANLGAGWRMAEFHDGGGWSLWARGTLPVGVRFWTAINDQPANPWN